MKRNGGHMHKNSNRQSPGCARHTKPHRPPAEGPSRHGQMPTSKTRYPGAHNSHSLERLSSQSQQHGHGLSQGYDRYTRRGDDVWSASTQSRPSSSGLDRWIILPLLQSSMLHRADHRRRLSPCTDQHFHPEQPGDGPCAPVYTDRHVRCPPSGLPSSSPGHQNSKVTSRPPSPPDLKNSGDMLPQSTYVILPGRRGCRLPHPQPATRTTRTMNRDSSANLDTEICHDDCVFSHQGNDSDSVLTKCSSITELSSDADPVLTLPPSPSSSFSNRRFNDDSMFFNSNSEEAKICRQSRSSVRFQDSDSFGSHYTSAYKPPMNSKTTAHRHGIPQPGRVHSVASGSDAASRARLVHSVCEKKSSASSGYPLETDSSAGTASRHADSDGLSSDLASVNSVCDSQRGLADSQATAGGGSVIQSTSRSGVVTDGMGRTCPESYSPSLHEAPFSRSSSVSEVHSSAGVPCQTSSTDPPPKQPAVLPHMTPSYPISESFVPTCQSPQGQPSVEHFHTTPTSSQRSSATYSERQGDSSDTVVSKRTDVESRSSPTTTIAQPPVLSSDSTTDYAFSKTTDTVPDSITGDDVIFCTDTVHTAKPNDATPLTTGDTKDDSLQRDTDIGSSRYGVSESNPFLQDLRSLSETASRDLLWSFVHGIAPITLDDTSSSFVSSELSTGSFRHTLLSSISSMLNSLLVTRVGTVAGSLSRESSSEHITVSSVTDTSARSVSSETARHGSRATPDPDPGKSTTVSTSSQSRPSSARKGSVSRPAPPHCSAGVLSGRSCNKHAGSGYSALEGQYTKRLHRVSFSNHYETSAEGSDSDSSLPSHTVWTDKHSGSEGLSQPQEDSESVSSEGSSPSECDSDSRSGSSSKSSASNSDSSSNSSASNSDSKSGSRSRSGSSNSGSSSSSSSSSGSTSSSSSVSQSLRTGPVGTSNTFSPTEHSASTTQSSNTSSTTSESTSITSSAATSSASSRAPGTTRYPSRRPPVEDSVYTEQPTSILQYSPCLSGPPVVVFRSSCHLEPDVLSVTHHTIPPSRHPKRSRLVRCDHDTHCPDSWTSAGDTSTADDLDVLREGQGNRACSPCPRSPVCGPDTELNRRQPQPYALTPSAQPYTLKPNTQPYAANPSAQPSAANPRAQPSAAKPRAQTMVPRITPQPERQYPAVIVLQQPSSCAAGGSEVEYAPPISIQAASSSGGLSSFGSKVGCCCTVSSEV